jgi:hypothetical protein
MADVDGKRSIRLNKELIINATPQGVEIALLEDKKLVELHHEKADNSFAVGDLYLGKVKKLIPGLNAAFVDVGFEKDAFLHYTDLSPYARSLLKFTQQAMNDGSPDGFDFGGLPGGAGDHQDGKDQRGAEWQASYPGSDLKRADCGQGPAA